MPTIVWILIVLLVGAGGSFAGYTYRQKMVEEKINRSEETAKRLYEDAVRKADYVVTEEPSDFTVPCREPYLIRYAFCLGPLGEEIEFFKEY